MSGSSASVSPAKTSRARPNSPRCRASYSRIRSAALRVPLPLAARRDQASAERFVDVRDGRDEHGLLAGPEAVEDVLAHAAPLRENRRRRPAIPDFGETPRDDRDEVAPLRVLESLRGIGGPSSGTGACGKWTFTLWPRSFRRSRPRDPARGSRGGPAALRRLQSALTTRLGAAKGRMGACGTSAAGKAWKAAWKGRHWAVPEP